MGLNQCLLSVTNNQDIISVFMNIGTIEKNFDARFVYLQLIHITKWKFDYIVFRKNVR